MNLEYLGVSEKFTFQPDLNSRVALVSDMESIKQSMKDILSTGIGTRFYNEYYGSYLEYLTFEQNDVILKDLLIYYSIDALRTWEKRIKVLNVDVKVGVDKMELLIPFLILQSNEIQSLIYPFYREITQ